MQSYIFLFLTFIITNSYRNNIKYGLGLKLCIYRSFHMNMLWIIMFLLSTSKIFILPTLYLSTSVCLFTSNCNPITFRSVLWYCLFTKIWSHELNALHCFRIKTSFLHVLHCTRFFNKRYLIQQHFQSLTSFTPTVKDCIYLLSLNFEVKSIQEKNYTHRILMKIDFQKTTHLSYFRIQVIYFRSSHLFSAIIHFSSIKSMNKQKILYDFLQDNLS